MGGAIFFASRYGSTAQYAKWISEATGLPAFDVRRSDADPARHDFLILGSPVIYHRLLFGKWVRRHLAALTDRPVVVFTVSGAPAGRKLDRWIARSLPPALIDGMDHVALRGRQDPKDLTWWDRAMLIVGSLVNPDRQAGREELRGFDFMDPGSVAPVVEWVQRHKRPVAAGPSSGAVEPAARGVHRAHSAPVR